MSSNSSATSPRPPNLASTQVNISNSSSGSGLGGFGGAKQFKRNHSDYQPPPPLLNNAYANDGSNMGGAIPFPVDHQNHNNYSIMNPSVGGGGYYGSYNSNSPRDRVPVYGGYRDPRGKGDMRRGGEMEQCVHRSNPNPPPPPSGPPIAAVYSQIGQNRPQKSAVPTRNMDYYGPASGAIPPPLPPVALTTVIKDNTSPRSNNQFVPPLPVKPSPPVRPPPPATNDNTNRNAKSADDLSPARSNPLLPSSTIATSNKDPSGGFQKPDSLFNSAIKAKDTASGLRSPGPALPSSSLPTQHSLSMFPPPPVPPPIAITHLNAAVTTHPANSSSSSIGPAAASLKASDHKQSKPPSLAVPGSLSTSGPITTTASKGSGPTSNSSAARSNSISSEKDKDVVEKPAATPRSGGPLIRVITGALSQDEASSSKVFDKVAPSPHTLSLGPSTSSSSSNSSLTKRLGLMLNNPTPTPVFQSVLADAQKASSAKPVISVNEINNLYRPTDKIAAISSNASALNLLPTSATPMARSVSAPIVTLNATQGEEDGSKTVRRPRAEWGKGLVKRQISNPEKEQPNPMPAVPETVEVRAAEELSEAPAVSNDITVTPPVVKQEEGKDAESVKEKAQRSPNTFFSSTDTKIAKEKPNLEVKVVENNEKGTLIKTEDQKPDKNGVKPETATTASTANTAKLPATASATKRLLPPIHTSLIKKTSAIDKAAITKDIAAIINGSSSVAATTNATATATASAIPTPVAAVTATTAAANTVATTATANNDTNSNSSSNTTNNVSTNQSSAAESTAVIESSAGKPEAEEPAEKEEKPVEEGPAKKRKRRSKLQIRLDQEKQEQIQREKELLRLAEEEKMREIEREKDPQQFLDNLDHSISAATDTASIATANNNASNMVNNSMRKRKPIAYAVDQAPRKRGRPFGIKSPRHISNQPPKSDPDSVNADTDVKESDNNVKAVARGNDAIISSPYPNPNPTIATLASTVKVRRGGRGRGGRGERNRALEAQAAAQLIYQALHNTSNNGPTSTLDHPFNQAEGLSNTRRIREIYSYDPHKNTLARVFSREQDQIYARKAIQILLDFQSHAVESLNDMNAGYYHLIVENRSLFNTPLMPMPTSSDVCSAIDLLDTMIDAMYIQLKDFRAKQYSYEAILNDGKIATGNNGIDFPSSTFAQIFENNQWSISSAHLFSTMITQTPSSSSKSTTIQASSNSHPNPTATSDSSKAAAATVDSGTGDNLSKPVIGDPLPPALHTASVSETVNEYMTGGKLSYSSFSELGSYQPNIDRMKANRAIMTKVIRDRKVGKRKAWEELGDRYLAVEQKWCAHVDDLERQEGIDQKEGPTLRTASNSMRAFTGAGDFGSESVGMRSARLSVVGGDSL
eukprot:gene27249-35988_t